jgi:hypothetical protein
LANRWPSDRGRNLCIVPDTPIHLIGRKPTKLQLLMTNADAAMHLMEEHHDALGVT